MMAAKAMGNDPAKRTMAPSTSRKIENGIDSGSAHALIRLDTVAREVSLPLEVLFLPLRSLRGEVTSACLHGRTVLINFHLQTMVASLLFYVSDRKLQQVHVLRASGQASKAALQVIAIVKVRSSGSGGQFGHDIFIERH